MNAGQAKRTAREWVEDNRGRWPGLRAAHLVGGITTMPADAPFPITKDVDLHLIFDEGSPALQPMGPYPNILEVAYGGLAIEAGLKSIADYRSAEAVLANPEIAHHLTLDTLLDDPDGWLGDLQIVVRREYPRRKWALARLDYDRRGLAQAFAMRPMAAAGWGASGEVMVLGYTATRVTAALWVATLNPPKMGGRMLVRLCEILSRYDRRDLHEEMLALQGVRDATPERVAVLLAEAAESFDLALAVRRTPHPFQHKLQAHLRPYFVDSSRGMLAEGYHREALAWITPFVLGTADVILVDGSDADKPKYAARQTALLRELGMDAAEVRAAKFETARELYDRMFALAEAIIAHHPDIID